MNFTAVIQFIIALPKIFGYLKEFSKMISIINAKSAERKRLDAKYNLENAKTKKEVEDAARDLLNRS